MAIQSDNHSERVILKAILDESDASSSLFSVLTPNDFMNTFHSTVFRIAKDLFLKDKNWGIVEVQTALVDQGVYKPNELTNILDGVVSPTDPIRFIPLIQRNRKRMNILRVRDFLDEQINSGDGNLDVNYVYTEAMQRLHDGIMLDSRRGQNTLELFDSHWKYLGQTPEERERNFIVVSDWYRLKEWMPFERGNLYGVAGRPGGGKSAAMIHMLTRFALRGWKGVFFSIEMNRTQVCNRIIANLSGIEKRDLRFGKVDDATQKKLREIVRPILKNIHIVVSDHVDVPMLATEMYSAQRNFSGLDFVMVDYLQIMSPEENTFKKRYEEIGNNCRGVRNVCREINVAGIVGIQVGRGVEEGKDIRPIRLSDMRESGDIENHLDGLIALNLMQRAQAMDLIKMEILKNREGELGTVVMRHEKNFNKILEEENQ